MTMIARILILIGIVSIITGLLILFFPKIFSWFGQLPGDIRIEKQNTRIYIPLVSMAIVSIILTVGYHVFHWLLEVISKIK
jgi:hypothetical protein